MQEALCTHAGNAKQTRNYQLIMTRSIRLICVSCHIRTVGPIFVAILYYHCECKYFVNLAKLECITYNIICTYMCIKRIAIMQLLNTQFIFRTQYRNSFTTQLKPVLRITVSKQNKARKNIAPPFLSKTGVTFFLS